MANKTKQNKKNMDKELSEIDQIGQVCLQLQNAETCGIAFREVALVVVV